MQIQNHRLQQQVRQYMNLANIQRANNNNTSSAFSLPSQFKNAWHQLWSQELLDVFGDFYTQPKLILYISNLLFKHLLSRIQTRRKQIIAQILAVLQLEFSDKIQDQLSRKLHPLFQDKCLSIFKLTPDSRLKIIADFYSDLKVKLEGSEVQVKLEELKTQLDQPEFEKFLDSLNKICLHILLNEPPLIFEQLQVSEKKLQEARQTDFFYQVFKKTKHFCIDGFPKQDSVCLVVQGPPKLPSGHIFQGIKSSVLILESSALNQEIKSVVESKSLKEESSQKKREQQHCSTPQLHELLQDSEEEAQQIDATAADDILRPETPYPDQSDKTSSASPLKQSSSVSSFKITSTSNPMQDNDTTQLIESEVNEKKSQDLELPSKIVIESPSPRRKREKQQRSPQKKSSNGENIAEETFFKEQKKEILEEPQEKTPFSEQISTQNLIEQRERAGSRNTRYNLEEGLELQCSVRQLQRNASSSLFEEQQFQTQESRVESYLDNVSAFQSPNRSMRGYHQQLSGPGDYFMTDQKQIESEYEYAPVSYTQRSTAPAPPPYFQNSISHQDISENQVMLDQQKTKCRASMYTSPIKRQKSALSTSIKAPAWNNYMDPVRGQQGYESPEFNVARTPPPPPSDQTGYYKPCRNSDQSYKCTQYVSNGSRQYQQQQQQEQPRKDRSNSVLSVRIKSIYNEYIAARDKSRKAKENAANYRPDTYHEGGGGGGGHPLHPASQTAQRIYQKSKSSITPSSPKISQIQKIQQSQYRKAKQNNSVKKYQNSFSSPSAKINRVSSTINSGQTTQRKDSSSKQQKNVSVTGAITSYAQWGKYVQHSKGKKGLDDSAAKKKPPMQRRDLTLSPKTLARQQQAYVNKAAQLQNYARQSSLNRVANQNYCGGGGAAPNYLFKNLQVINSQLKSAEQDNIQSGSTNGFKLTLVSHQSSQFLTQTEEIPQQHSGRCSSRDVYRREPSLTHNHSDLNAKKKIAQCRKDTMLKKQSVQEKIRQLKERMQQVSGSRLTTQEDRRKQEVMLVGMSELGFDRNYRGSCYDMRGRDGSVERGLSPGVRGGSRAGRQRGGYGQEEGGGRKSFYGQEWARYEVKGKGGYY